MLTKAGLLRTKNLLLFSSDLRSLFVCAGGKSLQPRQFRAKNRVSCLGSVFHRPIVESCFASLSLHGILIDQGENDPLKIIDKTKKNHFEKVHILEHFQK